ncbi:MAG: hypothetical protein COA94_02300 [Rickettsiales bacterium]|nr:MAG: hypothetical protein COA94_02300 [Rickettsiales bacterium]
MFEKPLISFDYAIKFLLKNKEGYEIIEGFISALFAAENYKPVKITALLESESNKERADFKRSIADLVVEDTDGNKYIVEIERSFTTNFMHKACFNSSRLIADNLSVSQDYTNIKKIFHISLLYFETEEMQKPIYHGKTVIHEVDTAHPIDLRVMNQGMVTFENHNVFPEYFFISIPRFNDQINQEIDEWLYVMKNAEVKKDFKSPYMAKVAERLSVLKMDDEERNQYYKYLKESVNKEDTLTAALEKGIKKGMKQGREEGREEGMEKGLEKGMEKGLEKGLEKGMEKVAIAMLSRNKPLDEISEFTGLSSQQLLTLQRSLNI